MEDGRWPRASAWLSQSQAAEPRLGVVGLPFNRSVTPGRYDLGPTAIRKALERYSTFDFESGRDISELSVREFDDCPVHDADQALTVDGLYSAFLTPITCLLGGDNGVTRAGVLALGRFKDLNIDQIGLITLDAHLDLRDLLHGPMNGNPIRGLIEDGLPGENIHQIGLQSFANSTPYAADARSYGIHHPAIGTSFVEGVSQALEDLASRVAAIYVDIDLDVLDLAYAPACPGARPGGIDPVQLRRATRLCGLQPKVTCVDIVELDAERDVNQQTALAAAAIFLEFSAGVLLRP